MPLRDVKDLSAEARELLRKWCPRAVTIEDFDDTPVRMSFATLIACKERTLAGRIYKQLGLAPLSLAYQDEGWTSGCLYVLGSLAEVRAAITAAYERHGFAEQHTSAGVDMGAHEPHAAPRTQWREDIIVIQEDDDGFVAVGSREWELSFPGSNAFAVELSRTLPVLALTSGPAFDELSVYRGGALVHAWVPRGKRKYRPKRVSAPLPIELLKSTFGALDRWDELADLVEVAVAEEGDDDDAVGLADLMESFEHTGFWNEAEGILDSYVYGPDVPITELMEFVRVTDGKAAKVTAKPAKVTAKPAKVTAKPAKVTAKPAKVTSPTKGATKRSKDEPATAKPARTAMPRGTAVLVIVSKAIFEKQHPGADVGDTLPIDRYTSSHATLQKVAGGGSLVLVTVRPGDVLWLVAVLDAPVQEGGAWIATPNTLPVTDLTPQMGSVGFASGATLTAAPGKLGMALQTPRQLADGVLAVLTDLARGR